MFNIVYMLSLKYLESYILINCCEKLKSICFCYMCTESKNLKMGCHFNTKHTITETTYFLNSPHKVLSHDMLHGTLTKSQF